MTQASLGKTAMPMQISLAAGAIMSFPQQFEENNTLSAVGS